MNINEIIHKLSKPPKWYFVLLVVLLMIALSNYYTPQKSENEYYPNGNIRKNTFWVDSSLRIETDFYNNGEKQKEYFYQNDTLVYAQELFANSNLEFRAFNKMDSFFMLKKKLPVDTFVYFFPNSKVYKKGDMKDSQVGGRCIVYDILGNLRKEGSMFDGKYVGTLKYFSEQRDTIIFTYFRQKGKQSTKFLWNNLGAEYINYPLGFSVKLPEKLSNISLINDSLLVVKDSTNVLVFSNLIVNSELELTDFVQERITLIKTELPSLERVELSNSGEKKHASLEVYKAMVNQREYYYAFYFMKFPEQKYYSVSCYQAVDLFKYLPENEVYKSLKSMEVISGAYKVNLFDY